MAATARARAGHGAHGVPPEPVSAPEPHGAGARACRGARASARARRLAGVEGFGRRHRLATRASERRMTGPLISAEALAASRLARRCWMFAGRSAALRGVPSTSRATSRTRCSWISTQNSQGRPAVGRHPLPDRGAFEATMRAAGVRNDRPVVFYDAASSMAAARGWWVLRYFGHGDVSVLDGGLAAWSEAGYAVTAEAPHIEPGDFVARPGGMPLLDADRRPRLPRTVSSSMRAPRSASAAKRTGRPRRRPHSQGQRTPGHADGRPAGGFSSGQASGTSSSAPESRTGVEMGAYCGSGITAAHEVLALELAGHRAALYPGSWSEWIADPGRPVARGT